MFSRRVETGYQGAELLTTKAMGKLGTSKYGDRIRIAVISDAIRILSPYLPQMLNVLITDSQTATELLEET